MRIILFVLISLVVMLSGCAEKNQEPDWQFSYRGVPIAMHAEAGPILYRLGAPVSSTETPSENFEGMDVTYCHGSFWLSTYPVGDVPYVSGLWFADDSVSTDEGIRLGSSREEVEWVYGADSFVAEDTCVLPRGQSQLTILLKEDIVTGIYYEARFLEAG